MSTTVGYVIPVEHFNKLRGDRLNDIIDAIADDDNKVSIIHDKFITHTGNWFIGVFVPKYLSEFSPDDYFKNASRNIPNDFAELQNSLSQLAGRFVEDDDIYIYMNVLRHFRNADDDIVFLVNNEGTIKQINPFTAPPAP